MPVSIKIMPDKGLSYLRYTGNATVAEMSYYLDVCAAHPQYAPHYRHIADLSEMTGYDADYLNILKIQAKAVAMLRGGRAPGACVFYAPTPVAQSFAHLVTRSWEGRDDPVLVIFTEPEQVDSFLGLPDETLREMARTAEVHDVPRATWPTKQSVTQ